MKLAIIKYNAGNTQSLSYALERLGVAPQITDDPEELLSADKVIFPGVGEASTAMNYLKSRGLDRVILQLRQPFLGICLGMQLMCQHSEENDTPCLGLFLEKVKRFPSDGTQRFKIPHMGWNTLNALEGDLFQGIDPGSYVYFVHSYYVEASDHTAALTDYIVPYSAGLHKDNFYAVQFHPEKSEKVGSRILQNFISL
ncbi:MAG: imidazole glycerol phosphate synthase subunit HisH [Bacteroidia bacterium]|nr:imidazole glycerol phosphate synthase subunit HisH [Bacteroidia bacterium]